MSKTNGINITRFAKYNFDFLSVEEVIILEYLVQCYLKNTLDQVVPNKIETDTGIKRSKIDHSIKMLVQKKIISTNIISRRIHFKVDFEAINNNLNKIFKKETRYGYQYYIGILNPNAIKSKKIKLNALNKVKNKKNIPVAKSKFKEPPKQIGLFD